jgi:hypothetical protein
MKILATDIIIVDDLRCHADFFFFLARGQNKQTDPDRHPMCVSFSNEPIRVHQKKFEK